MQRILGTLRQVGRSEQEVSGCESSGAMWWSSADGMQGFLGLTRGAFQVQGCAGIDQKFAGRWNSAAGGALTMGCEVVDFCC